jgi:hypothetical protein
MFDLSVRKAGWNLKPTVRPNGVAAQASGVFDLVAIDAAQYGEKGDAATHDGVDFAGFF